MIQAIKTGYIYVFKSVLNMMKIPRQGGRPWLISDDFPKSFFPVVALNTPPPVFYSADSSSRQHLCLLEYPLLGSTCLPHSLSTCVQILSIRVSNWVAHICNPMLG